MYKHEIPSLIINTTNMHQDVLLFITTGPLGGDYKKITQMLLEDYNNFRKAVLYTTAKKKDKDTVGVDGYFVNEQLFGEMVGDRDFLFYRCLPNGKMEGLHHKHASGKSDWGRPIVFACEVDEAITFKTTLKENVCLIYINDQKSNEAHPKINPEVSFFVDYNPDPDKVVEQLKNVIQSFLEGK